MLYDNKWDAKIEPAVFSLEGLIAWLEKQPAKTQYYYPMCQRCVIGLYLQANDQEPSWDNYARVIPGRECRGFVADGGDLNGPADSTLWTFGQALARAHELAAR